MKRFITKYALSSGIEEVDARNCSDTAQEMIAINGGGLSAYFHKGEHFETMEQAIVKAEAMRKKKIENLYKQIFKLERLDFSKIEPRK